MYGMTFLSIESGVILSAELYRTKKETITSSRFHRSLRHLHFPRTHKVLRNHWHLFFKPNTSARTIQVNIAT